MEMVRIVRTQLRFALICFWLALAAQAHEPATGSSGVNSLDVCLSGSREHLLIGETASGEKPRLLYYSSSDGGHTWSQPVEVSKGLAAPHWLARGADAQIPAAGDCVIAVWQTAGGDAYGGGPMATALSSDGGKTWRPGPNPGDDGLNIGHGYIDITADDRGAFHLVWLDSRNGKQGLYYARSDDGGEHWSENVAIDSATCECCWNAIKACDGKLFVLYRDMDPRDMKMARSDDGGRSWRTMPVGVFDWHFNGCPEVGGGLAFTPNELHAVTWTGRQEVAGVYTWNSKDDGAIWESHRLDGPSARNPDIASRGNELAAVWDESGKGIFAASSRDSGKTWTTARVPEANEGATHPRVVGGVTGFRVFWTELAGEKSIWRNVELKLGR